MPTRAAEVVEERVVEPAAKAVGVGSRPMGEKKPKTRYVRGKKGAQEGTAPAPLPARSTGPSGRMMSRGMAVGPKGADSPKPKEKTRRET